MRKSTIDDEIIKYLSELNTTQKKKVFKMIKHLLAENQSSLENDKITRYNRELNLAMKRIDSGNYTTLEELEKEMSSW